MPDYKVDSNDPLPRYYQVYVSLQKRIQAGEFLPGDTLPSERQLVNDYGVSRITIVKALDLLERENLIERQHGRGNFVLDHSETSNGEENGRVAFCIPTFPDSYIFSTLIGATRVAMRRKVQLQIIGIDKSREEAKHVQDAIESGVDGVILFPRSGSSDETLYQGLQERHYPLVMIDRYYPSVDTDYVVFDDENVGYRLTEALIEEGHKRVAILPGHEISVTSVHNRLRGYQWALEAHGLPYDESLVCLDVYETLSPESFDQLQYTHTKLLERIRQDAPTALIAVNNPVARQMSTDLMKIKTELMQAAIDGNLQGNGYELDISIAAISHEYLARGPVPLVALAIQSGEMLGREAMELLLGRINRTVTGPSKAVTIPMEIVQPEGS